MTRSIHKPAYRELRKQLHALRTKAKLSQRALAARLGVPHSWVAKVESGERRLDAVEFVEFTQACGVNAVKVIAEVAKYVRFSATGRAMKGGPR